MSVEQNVELMRRWFQEVWNERRDEIVYETLAENATGFGQVDPGKTLTGPAGFLDFARRIRTAFPDLKLSVDDAFGSGNKVVVRWSAKMTHLGDGIGIPPTKKPVSIWGIAIAQIENGKIVQGWDAWDQAAMLEQIGVYQREPVKLLAQ